MNEKLLDETFQRVASNYPNLKLDRKIIKSDVADTYAIIREICHEMRVSQIGFLVSLTSCTTYSAIASMANEKHIIHIALDSQRCPKYDDSGTMLSKFR